MLHHDARIRSGLGIFVNQIAPHAFENPSRGHMAIGDFFGAHHATGWIKALAAHGEFYATCVLQKPTVGDGLLQGLPSDYRAVTSHNNGRVIAHMLDKPPCVIVVSQQARVVPEWDVIAEVGRQSMSRPGGNTLGRQGHNGRRHYPADSPDVGVKSVYVLVDTHFSQNPGWKFAGSGDDSAIF